MIDVATAGSLLSSTLRIGLKVYALRPSNVGGNTNPSGERWQRVGRPVAVSGQIARVKRRLSRMPNAVDDGSRAIDQKDDSMRWPSAETKEELPQSERMQIGFNRGSTTIGNVAKSCDCPSDGLILPGRLLAGPVVTPPGVRLLNISLRQIRKLDFEHQSP